MSDLDALDHSSHVRRAIDLAREAGDRGDGPYGSLLVRDGEVVMEETNRENTDDDIALHPELTLARRAAREFSPAERAETVMYTSTEPCPMCAGGIAIAGLGGVVYSVSAKRLGEEFGGPNGVPCGEIFERRGREIPVVGDVLADEGMALHREFR
ncbi:nucleoside deaminase [Halorussus gelatinilyticus]|uniref:Nucleoside deaminase n=1 Tax=Halorussus gelatinilyticus TaxID=2937524 RepID=A0A8U0IJP7_9EURY|nr:nucleoside deaminase [Halorussus gelatinilyticus]UPW01273.1 nucleoside deaminase [Halorussus gelatinilyticus]